MVKCNLCGKTVQKDRIKAIIVKNQVLNEKFYLNFSRTLDLVSNISEEVLAYIQIELLCEHCYEAPVKTILPKICMIIFIPNNDRF